MKRDWELIRDLMQAIEQEKLPEWDKANHVYDEHLRLMSECNLIIGYQGPGCREGVRLTMKGYDLLDALRSRHVFEMVFDTMEFHESGSDKTWIETLPASADSILETAKQYALRRFKI